MSEQEDIVPRTVIVDERLRKYKATSAMEAIRYISYFPTEQVDDKKMILLMAFRIF